MRKQVRWQSLLNHRAMRVAAIVLYLYAATGCRTVYHRNHYLEQTISKRTPVPHELQKTTMPTYRIEAPDILLIDAIRIVPKEPYEIEPLDILQILVTGTPQDQPILGEYRVDSSGSVILGPGYGRVMVSGKSIEEAQKLVQTHLEQILSSPEVSVSLAEPAARQTIAGEHLVGQDGTINMGIYGNVRVVGMTVMQAREAVEDHLSEFLQDPEIAVDVAAYNSKVYYVITQGAGDGDQIARIPITGNETVLDALSQIGGFTQNQSKNMWIARPSPGGLGYDQILPINWNAITQGGSTATNFQILPNDRVYVAEDKLVLLDNFVNKAIAPFERLFGFTLLGTQTLQTIDRSPSGFRGTTVNPLSSGIL